ncbi:tRNA-dihydrouridine(47) synthase [NAD(P)(+)]-like [Saccoglossus kowalevskii]|uniref:tRNA-dihydrouridine(47) synthase [NAD(P)(+)] n=1 Tax=Saccoglossus kowalevskii TaxID=10224 RepID=A0ABM0MX78_SACKO|nr:PREDICTED: tRNA-dihydrouridine(47) synthase [NAD(P)(+)]-like [Saccoglossus kowalevskii]
MEKELEVERSPAAAAPPTANTDGCCSASVVQLTEQRQQNVAATENDGLAKIKDKFIDWEKIKLSREKSEGTKKDAEKTEKTNKDNETDEPPLKKVKHEKSRGQNKHRPRDKKIDCSDRLCPSILTEKVCTFGEKCRFEHNVKEFMTTKPPDIGDKCYAFETYGKCFYSLMCRFGTSHLGEDYTNLIDNDKFKDYVPSKNVLSKDLQRLLWKKKYKYEKAGKVIDTLMNMKGKNHSILKDSIEKRLSVENLTLNKSNEVKSDGTTTAAGQNEEGIMGVTDAGPVGSLETTVESQPKVDLKNKTDNMHVNSSPSLSESIPDKDVKMRICEKKKIDFSNKLYLAPLTTVGNLPFRRICKRYGADITCGEMAMCTNLLQGQLSEWALVKRHHTEDLFGVQLCGSFPDTMTKCAEILNDKMDIDFIDVNVGCPIDLVFKKGGGCALMGRLSRFEHIITGMSSVMDIPITVKMRAGIQDNNFTAHKVLPRLRDWGVSMVTLHGRSREQRYTKIADWDYISKCAEIAKPMPLYGNGDILSYEDANRQRQHTGVSGVMIARGALIKPWVFTEIKEQRHWDISSSERFDILRDFTNYGLEHWGSDQQGVDRTRRFLLEWLSFLYRYIPVGILESIPQKINQRPPCYFGRDDLETLMASPNCGDWVKISEMLLGPVPSGFEFLPKHRANSYK